MIAKHIPIKSARKSSFSGLVNYILDGQNKVDRIGTINITNCDSDTPNSVIAEIFSTQQMNKRATSDKTYHLVISFHKDDRPNKQAMEEIEDELCSTLGFKDHQRISVVHKDTDNLHVHVAINKIHPSRLTIHNPFCDYKIIAATCEKLELNYNLSVVSHEKKLPGEKSNDIEFKAGTESLIGWMRQTCLAPIKNARSWDEMHLTLNDFGLRLHKRGNGFVFITNNGITVKASSVDRSLSKKKLTDQLGEFVSASPALLDGKQIKTEYQKKPKAGSIDTTLLYAEYVNVQKNIAGLHKEKIIAVREVKNNAIEQVNHAAKIKRKLVKNINASRAAKKIIYQTIYQSILRQKNDINTQYHDACSAIRSDNKKLAWLDWLSNEAAKGNTNALDVLRTRNTNAFSGNGITGKEQNNVSMFPGSIETITKNGTVIYNFGSTAIRDDGKRLIVLSDTSNEALVDILQAAMHKYGNHLAINGTDQFRSEIAQVAANNKMRITFDDKALEQHRKKLMKQQIFSRKQKTKAKGISI